MEHATTLAQRQTSWHVDDVAWTPLTGLFIKDSGYKSVADLNYTGGAYSIELTKVAPGGSSPTHVEPHAHLFYILSGWGEVTIEGEAQEVRPGSVSPISAGQRHSFRNLGADSLEMLVVYHPPRIRNALVALDVTVVRKQFEAEDVCSFELVDPSGRSLPEFSAGAHIDVSLPNGLVRHYSLCNSPLERHRYTIAVLKTPCSAGGSRAMHDEILERTSLRIGVPKNHFPLVPRADRSILIAGGIGITPILAMAEQLSEQGKRFKLHYCARSEQRMAFRRRIMASSYSAQVQLHFDDGPSRQRLDLAAVLSEPRIGTHVYVCGPSGFIENVFNIARNNGWNNEQLHCEFFSD